MKSLKSKETINDISAIWFKHDYSGFRRMECPKDEYSCEAEQMLKRLRFRIYLRGSYDYVFDLFTVEEIQEELCRTIDDFLCFDGSVDSLFQRDKESNENLVHVGFTDSKLNPIDRGLYEDFALDIYNYIVEEIDISLDTTKIDEEHCNYLRQEIKKNVDKKGYGWEALGIDGQLSLDDMNRDKLNSILWIVNPDPIILEAMKKEE